MHNFEPLLQKAQQIVNTHHKNESEFFGKCNFLIEFAQETDDAFGFVDGIFPNYRIGIHELFDKLTDKDNSIRIMTEEELEKYKICWVAEDKFYY